MTTGEEKYNTFLDNVTSEMYISEDDHMHAIYDYMHVNSWLCDNHYSFGFGAVNPNVYLHGSFRLGTVARPLFSGFEISYNIDMVCQFPDIPKEVDPKNVKYCVGNRLQENHRYSKLLSYEGSKCWTIKFDNERGRNYNLNILPSISKQIIRSTTSVMITKKLDRGYEWLSSDPEGYASWFDGKNRCPNSRLVSTPLQRAIQIMKRHRDITYRMQPPVRYPPTSMIITTLAAHLYSGEQTTFSALTGIVNKIHEYRDLLDYSSVYCEPPTGSIILRMSDGMWYIGNPTNPYENFARYWHHDNNGGARSFFSWIESIKLDLIDFLSFLPPAHFKRHLSVCLGISDMSPHFRIIENRYNGNFM